ncbi:MAG: fimbrillin family protein [Bacteroidales bacterium]
MKKNLLALVAFSGILFTSCSNEMDQMVEQQNERNAIGFSTYSMMSKGTPIIDNSAFAKSGSSFDVVAFLGQSANKYMQAQITHNGSSWNYANALDKAYWPTTGSLHFFAVAPYSDFYAAAKASKGSIKYANTNMTITYTVPTTTGDQQDLMYATTAPLSKPETGTNVALSFKHALNQIHFKGKTDSKNLKVIINPAEGIQLCNLYGSATGVVNKGDAEPSGSLITWDNHTNTGQSAAPVFTNVAPDENLTINTNESNLSAVNLTKETDVLMLLPQPSSLMPWNPSGTPKEAVTTQTGSYLKISCKLIALGANNTEVYLHGSADAFGVMYVPFDCSAMSNKDVNGILPTGKKITYTLIFGGGYTDEGQPILTPITFETDVQRWEEVSQDITLPEGSVSPVN